MCEIALCTAFHAHWIILWLHQNVFLHTVVAIFLSDVLTVSNHPLLTCASAGLAGSTQRLVNNVCVRTVSDPGTQRTKSRDGHTSSRPSHWSSDGGPKYVTLAHSLPVFNQLRIFSCSLWVLKGTQGREPAEVAEALPQTTTVCY